MSCKTMQPKIKRIVIPGILKIVFFAVAFFVIIGITKMILWSQSFMRTTGLTPVAIFRLLVNTGVDLKSHEGRTNILLLGIGGGTHAGADLTDTILVVSLETSQKKMAMISVPRDIWSDTLKDKVNSAYHYGEVKKKGGGLTLAKVIVEDMVGLPIHYVLLIDFSGFEYLIDAVGGIDIAVPQAFTDTEFPVAGRENDRCDGDPDFRCRYESVTFAQGPQHMNGERALMYVRSRHAQGEEGSDFARGRRQQEVLAALLARIKSPDVWTNPARIRELFGAFDRATTTDMRFGELATVGKALIGREGVQTKRISFEKYLDSPPLWMYGRYTLVPKENFQVIHEYIKTSLDK
ncbi:LCP family protein [Candidatus Gottesmanbacteria bacterium]|nr:LCP family protein [Candidatus Gottesmanbacteria bacterium]